MKIIVGVIFIVASYCFALAAGMSMEHDPDGKKTMTAFFVMVVFAAFGEWLTR